MGVHPLWGNDAFHPVSDYPPLFPKPFQARLCGKRSKFRLSQKHISIFIRQNFWWPFCSHWNPPYFRFFGKSPPISGKLLSPYFLKVPTDFVQFTCFIYFMCFSFLPYFDHDAFMHHTMHVLDAPGHLSVHIYSRLCPLRVSFRSICLSPLICVSACLSVSLYVSRSLPLSVCVNKYIFIYIYIYMKLKTYLFTKAYDQWQSWNICNFLMSTCLSFTRAAQSPPVMDCL